MAGRFIRHQLLVDPQGQWRQELWLDEFIASTEPETSTAQVERPQITTPLPINTCSEDSLTMLPRVGPVLAERIARARSSGVVFRNAADLQQVKGIGPAMAAKISPLVKFDLSCATKVQASAPEPKNIPADSR